VHIDYFTCDHRSIHRSALGAEGNDRVAKRAKGIEAAGLNFGTCALSPHIKRGCFPSRAVVKPYLAKYRANTREIKKPRVALTTNATLDRSGNVQRVPMSFSFIGLEVTSVKLAMKM